jgi:glutamyl-tRNA reductase
MTSEKSLFFNYSELHFQNCPIEFREILASKSSFQKINDLILKHTGNAYEFVNISTCNRFAICIFGSVDQNQILNIYADLSCSQSLSKEKLSQFLRIEFDAQALKLLFRVSASLDSMVLGESQILGQIKESFLKCVEQGFARNRATQIFSQNFRIAKKIRLETGIGANSLSIGHAAIQIISRVFHSFQDKKIVIFGAGEMAKVTAQYLLSSKIKHLVIANRTVPNARKLLEELNHPSCEIMPLEKAIFNIHDFDICIFAASGNQMLLTPKHLTRYSKKRSGNLSVMVDISVPRKVDPNVSQIENLFLFNVDDLNPIMEQNRLLRKIAASRAEVLIESEVSAFLALCEQKENLTCVGKFHSWLTNVINIETERYLKQLSAGKKETHKIIADAVAKKIISHAAQLAKTNSKPELVENSVGDLLEFLFNISNQPLLPENQKANSNVIELPRTKISAKGY